MVSVKEHKEILKENPGSVVFARYAEKLAREGNINEAIGLLEEGIDTNPDYAPGHSILSDILFKENLDLRAAKELKTALDIDSQMPVDLLKLGMYYLGQSKPSEALPYLRNALLFEPLAADVRDAYEKAKVMSEEHEEVVPTGRTENDALEAAGSEVDYGIEIVEHIPVEEEKAETVEPPEENTTEKISSLESPENDFSEYPETEDDILEILDRGEYDLSDCETAAVDTESDENGSPEVNDTVVSEAETHQDKLEEYEDKLESESDKEYHSGTVSERVFGEMIDGEVPESEPGVEETDEESLKIVEDVIKSAPDIEYPSFDAREDSVTDSTLDDLIADYEGSLKEGSTNSTITGDSFPGGADDGNILEDNDNATVTIAEIYVTQGLISQAIDIYTILLEDDPDNEKIKTRLEDLRNMIDEQSGEL